MPQQTFVCSAFQSKALSPTSSLTKVRPDLIQRVQGLSTRPWKVTHKRKETLLQKKNCIWRVQLVLRKTGTGCEWTRLLQVWQYKLNFEKVTRRAVIVQTATHRHVLGKFPGAIQAPLTLFTNTAPETLTLWEYSWGAHYETPSARSLWATELIRKTFVFISSNKTSQISSANFQIRNALFTSTLGTNSHNKSGHHSKVQEETRLL